MDFSTWLKHEKEKEGDDRDMDTLYDWLKCKNDLGYGYRKVTLIYTDLATVYKKAHIKSCKYGTDPRHYMARLTDEKNPEYYPIDYLLRFIEEGFLRDYYVTSDRTITDHSPYSSGGIAYEITVTDKLNLHFKASNSHYGINPLPIDPISADDSFNLRKAYNRIALDGIWKADKKHLEIKKITVNGPATIIFWSDGTKTVVKCDKDDVLDYEKGILYAALKKLCNKKEYDDILRTIDAWSEFNTLYTDLFPDSVEVEKPKKKVYKRHFGDSDYRCPHCDQNWIWTHDRKNSFLHDGFINITCRNCGRRFKYIKGGTYERCD